LSVEHKTELLTQIAANTFENSRYFFAKDEIQEEIAGYIRTLVDAPTDSATLRQNSIAILESIPVQHGLLVERAQEIYSFSHLTFQEYFTAQKIKSFIDSHNPQVKKLLANITDKRWSEVFALSVDMRWKADQLLFLKQIIDEY
jgi:predicted NACHT family NTPase